jgi:phytoene dehydrogenase-like protein
MRPARPFARASTPIEGLFLGSSGCHPGPGVTLAPGVLAARAVLAA